MFSVFFLTQNFDLLFEFRNVVALGMETYQQEEKGIKFIPIFKSWRMVELITGTSEEPAPISLSSILINLVDLDS